jgi:hypothetical protein
MGYVIVGHDSDGSLHVFGTHASGGEYSSESAAIAGRADLWGMDGPARFQDAVVVVVEKAPHVG